MESDYDKNKQVKKTEILISNGCIILNRHLPKFFIVFKIWSLILSTMHIILIFLTEMVK
jgi:hypothetical protein